MSKFVTIVIGAAEIAGGILLTVFSGGTLATIGAYLISAGVGTLVAGVGSLFSHGPINGFATTVRNPVAPWRVIYGRARTGGTLVHINQWGDDVKMLDLVIVLAAHPCQSVDAVLFDQQRVQIDTSAAPGGAAAGSGTSFTPVQQTVNIASIARVGGVVTVQLNANIPYLTEGDRIRIAEDGAGSLTSNALIGTFQVEEILSQVFGGPGSIKFTYLCGGGDCSITGHGHVNTLWADYGRKVYFEPLLGQQTLGQTFAGMTSGTPYDGDRGHLVSPEHPGDAGGSSTPNPWTAYHSLQGKTAVFLRLHYNDTIFSGGLPQISFLMRGKNDIADYRHSPPLVGYTENAALCIADFLANKTYGYKADYGTDIPLPELIAAANTCDELVPLANSGSPPATEPAYACNGQFELSMRRGEILQNLLTSCAGRVTDYGGRFIIWPGAYLGVSFAIGSDPGGGVISLPAIERISAGPVEYRDISIRELYNGVKGTFLSPSNKWQTADFPPYAQDSLHGYTGPVEFEGDQNLADDGGDRRWLEIQLPFTISPAAAQRIAKIFLMRARHRRTATLVLNMTAYRIAVLDVIKITWAPLNWSEKLFEVISARLRMDPSGGEGSAIPLIVELEIRETDPDEYEWNTSEQLTPQGYKEPVIPGIGTFGFFATEGVPGTTFPYPWSPAYAIPLRGDAYFTGPVFGSPLASHAKGTFGLQGEYGIDAQGNATAKFLIRGTPPANQLASIGPPQVTVIVGSAGHLPPGVYQVAALAYDSVGSAGPFGTAIRCTIPAGPSTGSLAVTVAWPFGANGGEVHVAPAVTAAGFFRQKALGPGATSTTITDFDQSTPGGSDAAFNRFAVAWKKIVHGGAWAQQVQAVTSNTITIGGDGMTTNRWAGKVLSLLGKLDSTEELILLNMPVSANTASSGSPPEFTLTIGTNSAGDQLPDLTAFLVPGDLVELRLSPTFTESAFSDPDIANPYFPAGAVGVESGHLAMVLTGPDAGDVQTIASVSADGLGNKTIFELAGKWNIQPDDGDLVIIVEPAYEPEAHTDAFQVPVPGAVGGIVAAVAVHNLAGQTWAVIVRTETASGVRGSDAYAPVREIFFFGSQGTRTITSDETMRPTDRIIDADASAGDLTYTLLPFSSIPNQSIFVQKIDSSGNKVRVLCADGDLIAGAPWVDLFVQFADNIGVVVPGNG